VAQRAPRAELDDMRERLSELDDMARRVAELEERVDFAERLLRNSAKRRCPSRGPDRCKACWL